MFEHLIMLMINFKISEDAPFIRIRRTARNAFFGPECFSLGGGTKAFFGDFDMNLDFRKVMGGARSMPMPVIYV